MLAASESVLALDSSAAAATVDALSVIVLVPDEVWDAMAESSVAEEARV